jgi:hypothetical protein
MIPIIAGKTGADPEAIKQVSSCSIPPPGGIVYLLRTIFNHVSASSIALWWDIMETLQTLQS